jgi:hypothetical protein
MLPGCGVCTALEYDATGKKRPRVVCMDESGFKTKPEINAFYCNSQFYMRSCFQRQKRTQQQTMSKIRVLPEKRGTPIPRKKPKRSIYIPYISMCLFFVCSYKTLSFEPKSTRIAPVHVFCNI